MNLCRTCDTDFGSVAAFDGHRVGSHDYTATEGLKMVPPREDGRRCLSAKEMAGKRTKDGGTVFTMNAKGAWSVSPYLNQPGGAEIENDARVEGVS